MSEHHLPVSAAVRRRRSLGPHGTARSRRASKGEDKEDAKQNQPGPRTAAGAGRSGARRRVGRSPKNGNECGRHGDRCHPAVHHRSWTSAKYCRAGRSRTGCRTARPQCRTNTDGAHMIISRAPDSKNSTSSKRSSAHTSSRQVQACHAMSPGMATNQNGGKPQVLNRHLCACKTANGGSTEKLLLQVRQAVSFRKKERMIRQQPGAAKKRR